MLQIYFYVEGKTEQGFVEKIMRDHFAEIGLHVLGAIRCTARSYPALKQELGNLFLEHDRDDVVFTSMFDLYGLRSNFKGFPGWDAAAKLQSPRDRVALLEEEFGKDMAEPRFLPHIQLCEFETILLCGPEWLQIDYGINTRGIANLHAAVAEAGSVELVNDSQPRCPSNRIKAEFPKYGKSGQKTTVGVDVAAAIGLPTIRGLCPHFDAWVTRLETLGAAA